MRIRFSITAKLILVIVLFAALVMIIVSISAYTRGRSVLEAGALTELTASSFEKQSALNDWVFEKEAQVVALTGMPPLREDVTSLSAARVANDQAKARVDHDKLIAELQPWSGTGQDFLGWMVLDPGSSQIEAATDTSQEGKFREDQAYFINGKRGVFTQNPYYSLDAQTVMFTVAAPIHSADGQLVGVLAGNLDLTKVNAIIGRRTGARQSEDSFLVNLSDLIVTQPRFMNDPAILQQGVHTEAVRRCLMGSNGSVALPDYRAVPSFIVYHWLPTRQLCLIVKMDQAEALAPAITLGNTILITSILTFLGALGLAFWLASTITLPLKILKVGVESFGLGKLDLRIPETSQDELGQLTREFNRMADSLSQKDAQIHAYATDLEQKVVERTSQLAASEERYRTVADFTYDWEYWIDPDGKLLYISPSCERISGYAAEEFVSNYELLSTIVHPEDRDVYDQHKSQVWNNNNDNAVHEADFRIIRRDGEVRWIGHTCQLIRRPDGTSLGRRATNRDINERKNSEERIRKLYRVLAVLSDTNQSIVRIRDLSALFASVCNMALEKGGFVFVWIGLVDPMIGNIIPAAYAGKSTGYLDKFVMALNDPTQGLNQISKDLQNGQRCLYNDLGHELLLAFLRPEIEQLGFCSSVVLPLQVSGKLRGLINFYSNEPGFFDDDELRLLGEMAMDLSYSIEFNDHEVIRRLAEEAVKKSEELYRTLVEQASDGIFLADQNGHYIEVNTAGSKLLGYTHDEILQLSMRDVTKHTQVEPLRFKELLEGKTLLSEREMIRKDGSLLSVEISARQLPDGRLQGIVRDISDRKRAEDALRKSQLLLNETQQITKVGGWELDLLTNQVTWTDEVYQIHEVSKAYDPGSPIQDIQFYAPEDQIKISEALRQAVENGIPYSLELQLITAKGSKIWVRTIGQAEQRDGKNIRIFGNIMDINERKLAEEEIQKLNAGLEQRVMQRTQQLEAAYKEMEAFAYSVSHDLRAPLRAIDGFSRIIVDEYGEKLDTEGIRLLNVIRTHTAKMDQLITDLLALSRTARIELKFFQVDMATLVNSIYQEVTTPEMRDQISFSVLAIPDAYGDPNLLQLVWTNLLSNAIKYTAPKKERQIEVGGYREDEINVYYVKDNGVGFNPEYTHKLFGVFQRLHKSTEFEGTGVGLAIVQRIIQRHGGKVWGDGQLNQGATLYFSLPAIAGGK